MATDATSGSALSSSRRLTPSPSSPLAANEPPNRPAAWIFFAAAWNLLRPEPAPASATAPSADAPTFFFEGDVYRPSMDFLRLPKDASRSEPSPSTESVASERGGEGGGTPSAIAARAQRRRDAEGSDSKLVRLAFVSSSSEESEPLEDSAAASAGERPSIVVFCFAAVPSASSSSPKSSTNETFFLTKPEPPPLPRRRSSVSPSRHSGVAASDSSPKTEADSDCESSATSSSGPRLLAASLSPSLATYSSRLRCRSLFRRNASFSDGDASGGGVMSIAVTTKFAETATPLPPKKPFFASETNSSFVAYERSRSFWPRGELFALLSSMLA